MQQAAAEDDRLIGQTIGNYQVQSKLGEGGMGAVYLAVHPLIGKQVALKILHAEFAHNEEITERFLNEARAVNDIGHPNIVDILDYGVIPEGRGRLVYFIMEFLGGRSLKKVLRSEAPLPPERALAIGLQIADALAASHRHNIVHRDLKPDNVMLIQRGRQPDFVKVLDFGIAKLTGEKPEGSRRTRTGIVMGTPAYMSPEQCEGKPDNIDHRTDIYALGILLFEMLTGQVPFKGEGYGEVLVQHIMQAPARPSQLTPMIPPHVEAVVLKALEKLALLRYPNMDVFMQAMADPVGFVENRGGISSFLSIDLSADADRMAPTPAPGQLTPVPGQMAPVYTPVPGQLTPANLYPPVEPEPDKRGSGRMFVVLLALAVAIAAGVGVYMFVLKNNGPTDDSGNAVAATTEPENLSDRNPDNGDGTAEVSERSQAATDPEQIVVDEPDQGQETGQADNPDNNPDNVGTGDVEPDDGQDGSTDTEASAEKVTVKVITKPKGASVYLGDDEKPRGKTPLALEIDKGSDELTLRIKHARYKVATRTFTPETNQEFDLKLTRARGKRPSGGSKKTDTKTDTKTDSDVGLEQPEWMK